MVPRTNIRSPRLRSGKIVFSAWGAIANGSRERAPDDKRRVLRRLACKTWRNTLRYSSALRGGLVKPLNGAQSCLHDPGQPGPDDALDRAASIMIRNGLYLAETRFLDGVEAYNRHVMVLRDGTMRGGGGFYYTVGSYTCSGGKWKGEMTSQEHSPIAGTYPWARKVMSIGFTGTYSDDGAEFEATALAGKQSFRFKSIYRLLFAD